MREDMACSPKDSLEIRRQVQALDAASAANRLREEKTYEDHSRSVLNLFHGPSLRAMLTTIAAGRRTGERRVAGPSTVQVLEGEVRFRAGEERHVLSAGGTLVLEQLAMSLVRESSWSDGCLFGRSQKEDSPSLTTAAHDKERGCPCFRGEPLLCKTLRQGGCRRTLALAGEGSWQETPTRREGKEAP